jgi:hypothetical protein
VGRKKELGDFLSFDPHKNRNNSKRIIILS